MIFTLVIQVIPVCLALAGVLVWCSLHIKPPFSRVLRPIFTWISIILSLGSPLLFVVLAGLYWSSMVELFRMHPLVSLIMVTVSMSAWISLAVFLAHSLRPNTATSLRHMFTSGKKTTTPLGWSTYTGGNTNDFNAYAGGMAPVYTAPFDDRVQGFMRGVYWAASQYELMPDEKQYLTSRGENIEEVQRILHVMAAFRTSGKVMIYSPEPGYFPHPFPVSLPGDSQE